MKGIRFTYVAQAVGVRIYQKVSEDVKRYREFVLALDEFASAIPTQYLSVTRYFLTRPVRR